MDPKDTLFWSPAPPPPRHQSWLPAWILGTPMLTSLQTSHGVIPVLDKLVLCVIHAFKGLHIPPPRGGGGGKWATNLEGKEEMKKKKRKKIGNVFSLSWAMLRDTLHILMVEYIIRICQGRKEFRQDKIPKFYLKKSFKSLLAYPDKKLHYTLNYPIN